MIFGADIPFISTAVLLLSTLHAQQLPEHLAKPELRLRVEGAMRMGQWRECAELAAQEGRQHHERLRSSLALRGDCLARAGDLQTALGVFQQAVEVGFEEVGYLKEAPCLAKVWGDPRWKKVLQRAEGNMAAYRASINERLYQLFKIDQAGPAPRPRPRSESGRERQRRQVRAEHAALRREAARILARGGATTTLDYYHAAILFQHGWTSRDYVRARELALKAVELNPGNDRARSLAAAAVDRELVHRGELQRYGTQAHRGADGLLVLTPVDPTVTDHQRRRWSVGSLAEMHQWLARQNQEAGRNQVRRSDFRR